LDGAVDFRQVVSDGRAPILVLHAADLAGSAGGALAAGVFAIPLLGATSASYAGALLLGAAFLMVLPLLRD
jgi:hypothetical protein